MTSCEIEKERDQLALSLHRLSPRPGLTTFTVERMRATDLADSMRLRAEVFSDYDTPRHNGLEYDQFDTPAATYLLWRDGELRAQACARLIPCLHPYMLETLWPELLDVAPDCSLSVEVSRFALCHRLAGSARRRCLSDMILGLAQHARTHSLREYLFLANPRLIQALLGLQAPVEKLGDLDNRTSACRVVLSDEVLTATENLHK